MGFIQITFKRLTGILSKEQTEILETALLSMLPVVLTKILGFVFGLFAATKFGNLNPEWQNFLLANTIPDFLTNVIIAGSIGSIVIPTLVSSKKNNDIKSFYKLFSTILNISIIALSILSLIIAIFGDFLIPFLINFLSPTSSAEYQDVRLIVSMTRVLLIPQIILGVSTFLSSGLNVYNRFLIPQLAPLFFNIGRLMGLLFLYPIMGITGVVMGVIIGSVFHLLIQLPLAGKVGLKYMFIVDFSNKYLREILLVAFPRFLTLALESLARMITNFFAFSIRGGISALYFADQVASFIPSVFAFTFAMASFPKLSLYFEEGDFVKIRNIIIKTLNEILFLVLPIVVTVIVLRVPIARLFFGSLPNTALSISETYSIAWTLLLFGVGSLFICGKWFLYRAFYAAKDTKTPLFTSILSFVVTIFCTVIFINLFSYNSEFAISATNFDLSNLLTRGESIVAIGGIPLGLSIGYVLEFFLLLYFFNKNKVNLQLKSNGIFFLKKIFAGLVMSVVMYGMYRIWNALSYAIPDRAATFYTGSTTLNLLFLTSITVFTSFMVYYLLCLLLKVEELKILRRYLNPIFKVGGVSIK